MSDLICPVCGKSNPTTADACQYCGANLKKSSSDAAPFPDYLAGLSNLGNEEEDETPDWLKNLGGVLSTPSQSAPTPGQTPELMVPFKPTSAPEVSASDGDRKDFSGQTSPFQIDNNLQSGAQDEQPDSNWLDAFVQPDETGSSAASRGQNVPEADRNPSIYADLPDWLGKMAGASEAQPPAASSPQPTPPPAPKNTDWLSSLGRDFGGDFNVEDNPTPVEASTPASGETPDWLDRMGEDSSSEPTTPPPAESTPLQAQPDWMPGLPGSAVDSTPPASEQESSALIPSDEELSDWSTGLEGFSPTLVNPARSADRPQPSGAPDSGELPDWINSLQGSGSQGTSPAAFEPTGAADSSQTSGASASDELPDWMANLQKPAPAAFEPASVPDSSQFPSLSPFDELPDWMSTPGEPASTPAAPQPSSETPDDNLPDWLVSVQGSAPATGSSSSLQKPPETAPTPPVEESSEWLANLQSPSPASGETPGEQDLPAAPIKLPFEDEPDWLSSLQGSSTALFDDSAPAQALPDLPAPAPTDDTPDWLSSLQGSSAPVSAESARTQILSDLPAAAPNDETPDWLSNLQGSSASISIESSPSMPLPATPPAAPGHDVPDWLTNLQASLSPGSAEPVQPDIPAEVPGAELHDWASGFDNVPGGEQKPAGANPQQPFDAGSLNEYLIPEKENELPDWLARIRDGQTADKKSAQESSRPPALNEKPAAAGAQADQPSQAQAENSQEARSEVSALIPGSNVDQNIESILSMETPDWLSNFLPSSKTQPKPAAVEQVPAVTNIPTAELPSWVKALRPMESVMAETSESTEGEDVEAEGPLAGLYSILPTQAVPVESRSPKVYLNELISSETQLAQAALLENLIKSETTSQVQQKRSKSTRIQPLRWIIAAALLVVILFFAALGSKIFPSPAPLAESSPVGLFFKTISSLPEGAPVLVVMDYQPGFSGEMESGLGPVMEHLMSKKTRLAFVSTSPVGGLMADRILSKFVSIYPYQAGLQYVELGYLPGGASGIKVFADQPAATLGRESLSGNLWNTPVLKDLAVDSEIKLSNFAALIVATDNPDTGRLWIEQARPALGTKPMLMVVSAQAEPMIRPYLLSNQLNGLLTGMEGGVLYEDARGKIGQARADWDAYSAAILIAELIILIGGAWSLRAGLQASRVQMEQDET